MTTGSKEKTEYEVLWEAIEDWWRDLQKDPGRRAELRRAHSVDVVPLLPAYYSLLQSLRSTTLPRTVKPSRLPIVAGVLAHVRENDNRPVAIAMAEDHAGRPRVSDLRFRRLLKVDNDADLYMLMVRMVRLLGGAANVQDLTKALIFWNDRTRKEWAYRYYTKHEPDVL